MISGNSASPIQHTQPQALLSTRAEEVALAIVDSVKPAEELSRWLSDNNSRGFIFRGLFSTAADAVRAMPKLRADLILMDLDLSDDCGLKCAASILEQSPLSWIIMTSWLQNPFFIERAAALGRVTWLARPFSIAQFVASLEFGAASIRRARQIFSWECPIGAFPVLTPREQLLMRDLADGLLYKEIEDRRHWSHTALRKCQHKLYTKLKAHTRTEALNKWRELR